MYKAVNSLKFYVKDVRKMKNAIKKVVAVAMAFTLLGTGTTKKDTEDP